MNNQDVVCKQCNSIMKRLKGSTSPADGFKTKKWQCPACKSIHLSIEKI